MRHELTQKLYKEFPALYFEHTLGSHETSMCDGFCCNNGWYDVIHRLSVTLTELISALPEKEQGEYRAVQVKEKFGGLRFYMSRETREMREAISKAEAEAYATCEKCGAENASTGGEDWISTLCYNCRVRSERLAEERRRRQWETRPIDICAE